MTEQQAWDAVEQGIPAGTASELVQETWLKVVEDLGGAEAVEAEHQWANVREIVLTTIAQ